MTEYHADRDRCVTEQNCYESEHTIIRMGIYRYDGGQAKIQISRIHKSSEGDVFVKPGRFTLREMKAIVESWTLLKERLVKASTSNKSKRKKKGAKDGTKGPKKNGSGQRAFC